MYRRKKTYFLVSPPAPEEFDETLLQGALGDGKVFDLISHPLAIALLLSLRPLQALP